MNKPNGVHKGVYGKAAKLACLTLGLCLVGDAVMMMFFPGSLRLAFYAALSAALLAIIPSASALDDDGAAGFGSRLAIAAVLLLVVCLNVLLIPLVNSLPGPWDIWALGMDKAPAYYLITTVAMAICNQCMSRTQRR